MDISKVRHNTFVFTVWTLLYFWWFRWFLLYNWDFDIFRAYHWQYLWNEWWNEGLIIEGPYLWLFVLSVFLCIPVWIILLCFFLNFNFKKLWEKIFWNTIYNAKTKKVQSKDNRIRVKKKKSYKEIRPQPLAATPQSVAPVKKQPAADVYDDKEAKKLDDAAVSPSFEQPKNDDTFSPFDLDNDKIQNYEPDPIEPVNEDFVDIMEKAGAKVISAPHLGDTTIDYIAMTKDKLYYVLLDAEKGNWLADEERFNDEDPLWYSEDKNRVSPITLLNNFKKEVQSKLKKLDIKADAQVILVKTDGLIINYEDMLDTWKEMQVLVARSNIGQPEELPTFAATFPEQVEKITAADAKKIKSIFE